MLPTDSAIDMTNSDFVILNKTLRNLESKASNIESLLSRLDSINLKRTLKNPRIPEPKFSKKNEIDEMLSKVERACKVEFEGKPMPARTRNRSFISMLQTIEEDKVLDAFETVPCIANMCNNFNPSYIPRVMDRNQILNTLFMNMPEYTPELRFLADELESQDLLIAHLQYQFDSLRTAPISKLSIKRDDTTYTPNELFSIGQNDDGQLGVDIHQYPFTSKFRKVLLNDKLNDPKRIQIKKFACGSMFCYAIDMNGNMYAWGLQNVTGTECEEFVPERVSFQCMHETIDEFVDVACTEYAVAFVDRLKRVWARGGFRDQTGDSYMDAYTNFYHEPTLIANGMDVCSISGGESHFAISDSNGQVYTWVVALNKGVGEFGQLGLNAICKIPGPTLVPGPFTERVVCSGFSTFVLSNGAVWACGKNGYGELGLGHWESVGRLTLVETLIGINIVDIAGGLHHALFLDDSGTIWACGRNADGQLGLYNDIECVNRPTKVPIERKIIKIASGTSSFQSFAIDVDGELYACGQNQYGQLGLGDQDCIFKFQLVPLKNRKCANIQGGCQFTVVSLECAR